LRLASRIDDLEVLASAQAAELTMSHEPVDVANVARDALGALKLRFDAAAQTVNANLEPAVVAGDARRLHQIITNLLTNASKFTPVGGRVWITTSTDRSGDVRLEVGDTGPGIAEDELPHVFDRFWRGRQTNGAPGSGVGLAVVSELTRAHRGTATVTSTTGHGARFTITLPTDLPHGNTTPSKPPAASTGRPPRSAEIPRRRSDAGRTPAGFDAGETDG
jgi:two-component system sensor histidine kinase BaeS